MKRILIIRLSAIGDIIFSSPIIHALREKYPEAHISWLVEPGMQDLLSAHNELDEIIIWRKSEWKKLLKQKQYRTLLTELRTFIRQLRSDRYDMAIDMQGLLKSGIWARLSGARRRVGLGSKEGSQYLMTEVIPKPNDDNRIGSEYRELARVLGLKNKPFPMHLGISAEAEDKARHLIDNIGLKKGYIVFCPFTTRPQKHWFNDAWQTLEALITDQIKLPVVILGGPSDREAAAELCHIPRMINLAGTTTLQEAAAIIRGAAGVVGVDTGLTHLGTAFERPTVCLFGSTCPYLQTDSEKTQIIYHALDCSPCRRNPTCDGRFDCLREITAEEVLSRLQPLLEL